MLQAPADVNRDMAGSWKKFATAFASGFVFAMPVSITFLDYVGYVARVDGASMQPVLNPRRETGHDVIFLSRWAVRNYDISRGDIVSLDSPRDPGTRLVKRIIALEGDTVKTLHYKNRYVTVPRGHCWVEGDHHGQSMDSNLFGPVAVGLIHAKASHIIWPLHRWQRLESLIPRKRSTVPVTEEQIINELVDDMGEKYSSS
ncbi:mitochondrial inner membrane protease subunit 2-like [Glandiceps talaboti]